MLYVSSFHDRVPAPGYRDHADGVQRGSGGYGYSWASTGGSIHGLSLHFDVMWLYSNYAYYRAYGLQLRCLSE